MIFVNLNVLELASVAAHIGKCTFDSISSKCLFFHSQFVPIKVLALDPNGGWGLMVLSCSSNATNSNGKHANLSRDDLHASSDTRACSEWMWIDFLFGSEIVSFFASIDD